MIQDVKVADRQEDEIGEAIEITETGRTVLNKPDDTVETFSDGVREVALDEGKDMSLVAA